MDVELRRNLRGMQVLKLGMVKAVAETRLWRDKAGACGKQLTNV